MTQAICAYRREQTITGPLFLGADTHALSASVPVRFKWFVAGLGDGTLSDHLHRLQDEAQAIIARALRSGGGS